MDIESYERVDRKWKGGDKDVRQTLPIIRNDGKVIKLQVSLSDKKKAVKDKDSATDADKEVDSAWAEQRTRDRNAKKSKKNRKQDVTQDENNKRNAKGKGKSHSNEDNDESDDSDDEGGTYDYAPIFDSKEEAGQEYGKIAKDQIGQKHKNSNDNSNDNDNKTDVNEDGKDGSWSDVVDTSTLDKKKLKGLRLSKNALFIKNKLMKLGKLSLSKQKGYIVKICQAVLKDPQQALKRPAPQRASGDVNRGEEKEQQNGHDDKQLFSADDMEYKLSDLFDILSANYTYPTDTSHNNNSNKVSYECILADQIVESCMLSLLLLFKDIVPSYRIRPPQENESMSNVKLKKETKRIRDFEYALLGAYQRYIKFLTSRITYGLGALSLQQVEWNSNNGDNGRMLGLSALRCACELVQSLPFFNFRQNLLTIVVPRAAQPGQSPLCLFINCHNDEHMKHSLFYLTRYLF